MSNPISCVVTNVQRGSQRLNHDPNKHKLKHWRCELSALSSVYNLYFVAYSDTIHVYQPNFPDQSLSDEPLVLHPPTTAQDLHGYIDDQSPHSINRLHVDFLGREEIVLVACDDGDVIGYRTQEVQHAYDRRNQSTGDQKGTSEDMNSQIRVFLHQNVGQSAWGLAVHREARMIAVSANTCQVTVIAYALVGSPDIDMDTETADFPFPRRREHTLICTAESNIPSVSFDNTGGDRAGKWMFSSSIDGKSLLWNLHTMESNALPAREIRLAYCDRQFPTTRHPVCICPDYGMVPHAVWTTTLVDPQSFRQSYDIREAWGCHPKQLSQKFQILSNSIRQLDAISTAANASNNDSQAGDVEQPGPNNESGSVAGDHESEDEMVVGDSDDDSHPQAEESLFVPEVVASDSPQPDSSSEMSDEDDDYVNYADYAILISQPSRLVNNTKEYCCDTKTRDDFSVPDHQPPCLIVTKSEIYLFQRPFDPAGDNSSPIITMRNPLLGAARMSLPYDRLCYSAQIPELGVFVVASPGGRAAIFGLTQYKGDDEDVYGFRLDHILPSTRQERELSLGGFPGMRLVGIAVGPIQGMLNAPEDADIGEGPNVSSARRWRLMMMYDDHTVLSYELGRYRESEEAPGLADLVV